MEKWITALEEEDRKFIKRFILSSGSLKELSKIYNVSYPTLRIRLDRLIQKITVAEDPEVDDDFKLKVKMLVAEEKLTLQAAKELISEYEKAMRREKDE